MLKKIVIWVGLFAGIFSIIANFQVVWEKIKMIYKIFDPQIAPIVILIIAVIIYLYEKYKEVRNKIQSLFLIIDSAEYGANGKFNDVTKILWSKINSGKIEKLPITNEIFGPDPIPTIRKTLNVKYKYCGEPRSISVPERQTLSIP